MPKLTTQDLTGLSHVHAAWLCEYIKDWNAPRAAEAVGLHPGAGHTIKERPEVQEAILQVLEHRLTAAEINAEWALMEAVDNHMLARQAGKLSASNTALGLIMKHAGVDAFAADKVLMASDEKLLERLQRGRKRKTPSPAAPQHEVSFF